MKKRIIFGIVLFCAVFYAQWWAVAILAFCGAFVFSYYYEIVVAGVLMDILYGSHTLALGGTINTLVAIIIYFVATYTRKFVR